MYRGCFHFLFMVIPNSRGIRPTCTYSYSAGRGKRTLTETSINNIYRVSKRTRYIYIYIYVVHVKNPSNRSRLVERGESDRVREQRLLKLATQSTVVVIMNSKNYIFKISLEKVFLFLSAFISHTNNEVDYFFFTSHDVHCSSSRPHLYSTTYFLCMHVYMYIYIHTHILVCIFTIP